MKLRNFIFGAFLATAALAVSISTVTAQQTASGPIPTSSATIGIAGVTSTAAEAGHVIKAAPGNLYSVYATNITSTAGFLIVVNATTVPGAGALTGSTVLDCVALPASGTASINYGMPPKVYSVGIVALVSSASTCFTYTTGTITAFISGSAP